MHLFTAVSWALCLVPAVAAAADVPAQAAAEIRGKRAFDKHCAECHAAGHGHPGTQRLGWNKGEAAALLEKRTDLSADYIQAIVRRGLFEMPPFRPTELPDAELAALAQYLAARVKASSRE